MKKRSLAIRLKEGCAAICTRRHFLALGIIAVCCALVFLWAGSTFLPAAANQYRRVIVNDDYGTASGQPVLTQALGKGDTLRQTLFLKTTTTYGVLLDISTFGRVAHGTVHLRLFHPDGGLAAACDTDMAKLLDNTFHRFIFDRPVSPEKGKQLYTLEVTTSPKTPDDTVAFHMSDGPAENFIDEATGKPAFDLSRFHLDINGKPLESTLALQYVSHYAGPFIYRAYTFFAVLLTLFLLVLYLLVFVFKKAAHVVFAFSATVLGFVFIFVVPPRAGPDEYVHIGAAYKLSNMVMKPAAWPADSPGKAVVRSVDRMELSFYVEDSINVFAYQSLYHGLTGTAPTPAERTAYHEAEVREAGNYRLPYIAPAIGISIARLLGLGRAWLLVLGSAANLLFYVAMVTLAIRKMPFAKPVMLCAGLLPSCLQLAGSFSFDIFIIGLCYYYLACCLHFASRKTPMSKREAALLAVLAVLIAPAKIVYLFMLLLVFIIPAANFPAAKRALLFKGGIVLAAAVAIAVSMLAATLHATATPPDATAPPPDAQETERAPTPDEFVIVDGEVLQLRHNGDAIQQFTPRYILTHPTKTLRLLATSFWSETPLWLDGLLGGRLGEIIAVEIEVNRLFVTALLGVLLCSALPAGPLHQVLPKRSRRCAVLLVAGVFATTLAVCLHWTPANYTTLFGMQGRYLLPMLPLGLLALGNVRLRFEKPVWRTLATATCALVALCQLSAFLTVITL